MVIYVYIQLFVYLYNYLCIYMFICFGEVPPSSLQGILRPLPRPLLKILPEYLLKSLSAC
jgi:hypothetical protein